MRAAAAAAATKSLQSCPTLCNPIDGSPPGSPVLGFSRQEHWSGLPFPSLMHESESEVAQSCPTLSDPMDCSLPGSSIHGIFQAGVLEWGAIAFSRYEDKPTQKKIEEISSILAPLFMFFFLLPVSLSYVNWTSLEGCLFYLRFSFWSSDLPLFYIRGLFPLFLF